MRGLGIIVVGVALGGAGCLSEKMRAVTDADATDTLGDTSFDTSEVVDPCLGKSCDDNDECTYDRCVPETGECEHLGVPSASDPAEPPMPGCVSDADCEDGDACTTNVCVTFAEGCGTQQTMCVFDPIPGCGTCPGGCDDGDPCTRDLCLGAECWHEAAEGCLSGCVEAGTTPIEAIENTGFGYHPSLKTVGQLVFPALYAACDDGPDCNCTGFAGVAEGTAELLLAAGTTADTAWGCKSSGCGAVRTTCEPAHFGVRYRVWGIGLPEWELLNPTPAAGAGEAPSGDAAVPAQMVAGLAVEDFCLETTLQGLAGTYEARLEIAGTVITATAEIMAPTPPILRLGAPSCEGGCPAWVQLPEQPFPVVLGDGFVDVQATLPSLTGPATYELRLYSNRNTLRGAFGVLAIGAIAAPQGGTMTLTRVAPGALNP